MDFSLMYEDTYISGFLRADQVYDTAMMTLRQIQERGFKKVKLTVRYGDQFWAPVVLRPIYFILNTETSKKYFAMIKLGGLYEDILSTDHFLSIAEVLEKEVGTWGITGTLY